MSSLETQILSNGCGVLVLNRPQHLNALTFEMLVTMFETLKKWKTNPNVKFVLIYSKCPKSFCSGGDILSIADSVLKAPKYAYQGWEFIFVEYRMDLLMATYPKPIIAIADGYFMGGGAAIALHSLFTIVTESAVFAMPEVSVHYFPDVLVSWYLTRIQNNIGTYLALTGCQLNYLELFYCKLAQYYCSKSDVSTLIYELTNQNFDNNNDNTLLKTQLSKVFEKYHHKLNSNKNDIKVSKKTNEIIKCEPIIKQCFKYNTLEMILDALRNESTKTISHPNNNVVGQWCLKTYDQLMNLSPLSLKITLRLLAVAKHETIAEHAQTCFKVGTRLLTVDNFYKGVYLRLGPNKKQERNAKKPKEAYPYAITHENMSLLTNGVNAFFDTNANNLFELCVTKNEHGHTIIAFVNQRIDANIPAILKVDDIIAHHKL